MDLKFRLSVCASMNKAKADALRQLETSQE